jgi:hypothetical protein
MVLTTIDVDGKSQDVINTLHGYSEALTKLFALRLGSDEILQLWEKAWSAHLAWVDSEKALDKDRGIA